MKAQRVGLATLALALLILAPQTYAGGASGALIEPSTVDTVAGPGLCRGRSELDPASWGVRSLAIASNGNFAFDAGPPDSGQFGVVPAASFAAGSYPASRVIPRTVYSVDPLVQKSGKSPYRPWGPENMAAPGLALLPPYPDGHSVVIAARGNEVLSISSFNLGVRPTYGADANSFNFILAGDALGTPGTTGDGGPASESRFTSIESLAGDDAGNFFVADATATSIGGVRIRFVNTDGLVGVFQTQSPGVKPTPPLSGTFYSGTAQEIKVGPAKIDTIAGGHDAPNSGEGGPARQAGLAPTSSMVVAGDRLYIASYLSVPGTQPEARVRMINLGGKPIQAHGFTIQGGAIATVAGGHGTAFAGDGGPAQLASFSRITGMGGDSAGNLYLADRDHQRIRRVDAKGIITTVAGTGGDGPREGGFNGNDRPALDALLNQPFDVKVDPGGKVYISDDGNGQIRYVDQAGIIHAGFGIGLGMTWRCHPQKPLPALGPERDLARKQKEAQKNGRGPQLPARPGLPTNFGGSFILAPGGAQGTYVAAHELGQIKLIEPSGIVSTVAGDGEDVCPPAKTCPRSGGDGGPATSARLDDPTVIAASPGKGLYVFDKKENRIRFVNTTPRAVKIHGVKVPPGEIAEIAQIAPKATPTPTPSNQDQAPGAGNEAVSRENVQDATLGKITSMAADGSGNLFLAEPKEQRVRKVGPSGAISTFIGKGGEFNAGASGCCDAPSVVASDPGGDLYIFDRTALKIFFINRRRVALTAHGQNVRPGAIVAIAGSGKTGFGGDNGPALAGAFTGPSAMVADKEGSLYVADPLESIVRKIDPAGILTTAVGAGTQGGFNGDGLKAQLTALNAPSGLALDTCGNLLIADPGNDRVRRVNLAGPCAAPAISAVAPPPVSPLTPTPIKIVALLAIVVAGLVVLGLVTRKRSS